MSFIEKLPEVLVPWKSSRWVIWKAKNDEKACDDCKDLHGRIFPTEAVGKIVQWPKHLHCRCTLDGMEVIPAGCATQDGVNGADYWLIHKRKLPDNYLSKKEAKKMGWKNNKGNLTTVTGGKLIGGNVYHDREGKLPQADGRIWYEADINYTSGYRGAERILYSSDGLVFVTYDHYKTFYEISD